MDVALAVLVEVLGGPMVVLGACAESARSRVAAVRAQPPRELPRQASSTAPPVIVVCRDADVDPAEPASVVGGSTTTSSTPSSVRTICAITV